jgi:putative transposase
MKDLLLAPLHLAVMTVKLCGPGGVLAVIAENLLLKQQLIVLRRARRRAPNLPLSDRPICALGSLFLSPGRIRKVAVGVCPRRSWRFIRHWGVGSTADCSSPSMDLFRCKSIVLWSC